jgi:peptide/nickel transport system permease protein
VLAFIGRRISIALLILFGSSFIAYNLEAFAGDPLAGLAESQAQNKDFLIATLTRELQLDVPPPARYFLWLKGVLGFLTGHFDLGMTREASPVLAQMATAIPVTLRLVTGATFTAIVLGITIGIISAIRQYSRLDYVMTFISFLLFSLPVFWVAVLLKQYFAIGFNDFLGHVDANGNPSTAIPVEWIIGIAAVLAVVFAGFVSGSRKRVMITWSATFVGFSLMLTAISFTNWLLNPQLSIIGVGLMSIGVAVGLTYVLTGFENRAALKAGLTTAGIAILSYYPFQLLAGPSTNAFVILALGIFSLAVAFAVGWFFVKIDRGPVIRVSMFTAVFAGFFMLVDRIMQSWSTYFNSDAINRRPIPTIGDSNPLLTSGDFWVQTLDGLTHVALPTLALTLISFAGYVRYARGSLLEVLNMDYIRTARAKGLGERQVILRHAMRNAMIPLTTLIAFDIAGILGGAIITESVFGWKGMGTLFRNAINAQDLNLFMGGLVLTSFLAVMANLAADLLYSALDPRIRIGKN